MDEETVSSGPPRSPRRHAALWAGVGVLGAGVAVLGYAIALADRGYPMTDRAMDPPPGVPPTLVVVTGATVATLTWVFLALRRVAARRLPPRWVTVPLAVVPVIGIGLLSHAMTGAQGSILTVLTALLTAVWTYLAAGWVRDAHPSCSFPHPSALVTVMLALAAAAVTAFVRWLGLRADAFPGDRALLVTTAYVVLLLGTASVYVAALHLPARRQAIRLRSRRGIVGFVGGVAAVAVATGAVVAVAGDRSRIDATTTAAVPPPPTPTDLTQVAWRWPEGDPIHDAVAAGAGVVVSTSHGVVALDGRTGQERWHYHRDNARAADLEVVDGDRGVIASIDGRLHSFDAFTGELRWQTEPPTARVSPAWSHQISTTDSTVIRTREGYGDTGRVEVELAGIDARTGEPAWRYSPPPGCESEGVRVVADMVIVELDCEFLPFDTAELVALDGSTGSPVWRKLIDDPVHFAGDGVCSSTPTLCTEASSRYLDPRTGREITELTQILGERNGNRILGKRSDEVLTSDWQLFRLGEPGPRWQAQDTSQHDGRGAGFRSGAIFLRDSVVVLDGRLCPGDDSGMELVVLDRDDGTRRRSFDCQGLSQEDSHDVMVFRAPGAVVLVDGNSLIGISG